MKKFFAVLLLASAGASYAGGYHGHRGYHHHYHHQNWNWVGPALLGGAVVYAVTRPPAVIQQPPVVLQQPPVYLQSSCTPWTEVQNADGSITRTRTCTQ